MHIMIVAQRYAPEEISGALFLTDLTQTLLEEGHQVTIITEFPNYPYGKTFVGYRKRLWMRETFDSVTVLRFWSHYTPGRSTASRIWNWLTFSSTVLGARGLTQRPDILMTYSPPLTLGLSGWLLSKSWGIPWIIRLEDIFPDAAINTGILTSRRLIALLQRLERFIYDRCDHVSVITPVFRRALVERGVDPTKITVHPLWADPNEILPRSKHTLVSRHTPNEFGFRSDVYWQPRSHLFD